MTGCRRGQECPRPHGLELCGLGVVEALGGMHIFPMEFLPVDSCADKREEKHEEEDFDEAAGGGRDGLCAFGEKGVAAVDEFDVDPINEQGGLAQLEERAESAGGETPATPGVCKEGDEEEKPNAHHEEIGAGVPVIVNGVEMELRVIETVGESDGGGSGAGKEGESFGGVHAGRVAEKEESGGESGEGEGGPREDAEKPGLGGAKIVASVDVGLEIPRKPSGTVSGVERRGEESDEGGDGEGGEDDGKRWNGHGG